MSGFDFSLDADSKRRAFRAQVPGLVARVKESGLAFHVQNISATGFAIQPPCGAFGEGEDFQIDLLLNHRLYIADLECVVIRKLDNGMIGCDFKALDRRQEARLDKLVLEVQKRMIARKQSSTEEEK